MTIRNHLSIVELEAITAAKAATITELTAAALDKWAVETILVAKLAKAEARIKRARLHILYQRFADDDAVTAARSFLAADDKAAEE